jgi:hypothetical protein
VSCVVTPFRVHLLAVDQLSQRRINLSEERDRKFASTPPESVTQLTELKPKVASHAASQSMGGDASANLPQSLHITPIALVHSVRSHAGAAVGIALLATAGELPIPISCMLMLMRLTMPVCRITRHNDSIESE